eukprot:scaffold247535_cov28-Tisochrysis_lutea.AAC.2
MAPRAGSTLNSGSSVVSCGMRSTNRMGISDVLCSERLDEALKPIETTPKSISPTEKWNEGPTTRPLKEGFMHLPESRALEAYLAGDMLARLQHAGIGREAEAGAYGRVVWREREGGLDLAVVFEHDLVSVLRVDVHISNVEHVVEPCRLGPKRLPLHHQWESCLSARNGAVGVGGEAGHGLRLEDDCQLAVPARVYLAARGLDYKGVVLEHHWVELDGSTLLPATAEYEPHSLARLISGRGHLLPLELHPHVGAVVQLDRPLRGERYVARLQQDERALEAHFNVRRGAGQLCDALFARVVRDEHLLLERAVLFRQEREQQLHRLAGGKHALRGRDGKGIRHREQEAALRGASVAQQERLLCHHTHGLPPKVHRVRELEARPRPART